MDPCLEVGSNNDHSEGWDENVCGGGVLGGEGGRATVAYSWVSTYSYDWGGGVGGKLL